MVSALRGTLPFLLAGFLVASAAAQPPNGVVPASWAQSEAPGLEFWPVTPFPSRTQVIIDRQMLGAAVTRPVTAVWVRRDSSPGGDGARGGRAHLTLDVGDAGAIPVRSSTEFAANFAAPPRRVFDGSIDLPELPPPTMQPAAWSAPDALRLPFQAPVTAAGLGLTLDARCTPWTDPTTGQTDAPFWPIDAAVDTASEPDWTTQGGGCGAGVASEVSVGAQGAALGETITFQLATGGAEPGTALCALGVPPLGGGIELGPFGAPGCRLELALLTATPAPLRPLPAARDRRLATLSQEVPFLPVLGGVPLRAQWLLTVPGANPADTVTTDAFEAHLATRSSIHHAWVHASDPDATHGRIHLDRIPVLRFD